MVSGQWPDASSGGCDSPRVAFHAADVTDRAAVQDALKSLSQQLGPVDVLDPQCRASAASRGPPLRTSPTWKRCWRSTTWAACTAVEAVLPAMLARRQWATGGRQQPGSDAGAWRGRGGILGQQGGDGDLSESLRPALRRRGIVTTTCFLGFVRTPMSDGLSLRPAAVDDRATEAAASHRPRDRPPPPRGVLPVVRRLGSRRCCGGCPRGPSTASCPVRADHGPRRVLMSAAHEANTPPTTASSGRWASWPARTASPRPSTTARGSRRFRFWENLFLRVRRRTEGGAAANPAPPAAAGGRIAAGSRHRRRRQSCACCPRLIAVHGHRHCPAAVAPACRLTTPDASPLRLALAEGERIPFEDRTFDAVLCVGGFNFFSDPRTALARWPASRGPAAGSSWPTRFPTSSATAGVTASAWPFAGPVAHEAVVRPRVPRHGADEHDFDVRNAGRGGVLAEAQLHPIWCGYGYCLVGEPQ